MIVRSRRVSSMETSIAPTLMVVATSQERLVSRLPSARRQFKVGVEQTSKEGSNVQARPGRRTLPSRMYVSEQICVSRYHNCADRRPGCQAMVVLLISVVVALVVVHAGLH